MRKVTALLSTLALATTLTAQNLPQTERQPLPWASMQNTRRTATWTMRPAITPDLTWSSPSQSARFTAGSW